MKHSVCRLVLRLAVPGLALLILQGCSWGPCGPSFSGFRPSAGQETAPQKTAPLSDAALLTNDFDGSPKG
ncbi:MAG: hypothetical protein LBS89_03900 [Zoogloeaceae bacterium]|nr:hypothetical protein [Zoogloeaceae bacterium]